LPFRHRISKELVIQRISVVTGIISVLSIWDISHILPSLTFVQ